MAWATRVFAQAHRVLMASATTTTTATAAAPKRGRPAGILKVVPVSPALGEFLGASEVSRTDAVKKVWEYIKRNDLQDERTEWFSFQSRMLLTMNSVGY